MALTSTLEDIEFLSLIETMGVFYGWDLFNTILRQNQGCSRGVTARIRYFRRKSMAFYSLYAGFLPPTF